MTVRRVTGTTAPTAHSGTLVADFGNTVTHASDYGLTASQTYTYALFARDSTQHYARGLSFTRTTPTPPATPDWTSTTVWPLSGSPTALSCAAPAACTVVDWHGFEVHWDGTTWSAPARVADQPLLWITCNSSDFCMTGNYRAAYVSTATGWQRVADPTAGVRHASCASATLCLGAGGPLVLRWDGARWIRTPVTGSAAVSCVSDTTWCVAVTSDGTWTFLQNGRWTPVGQHGTDLTAVSCASTSHCVAVGPDGDAITWDGSAWSSADMPAAWGRPTEISCVDDVTCAVVSDQGYWWALRSGSWDAYAFGSGTIAASCTSDEICHFLDRDGRTVVTDGPGGRYGPYVDQPHGGLSNIACAPGGSCGALSGTEFLTIDQDVATPQLELSGLGYGEVHLACPSAELCVVTSNDGTARRQVLRRAGDTWSATPVADSSHDWRHLSCASPTWCIALGHHGTASSFDGHRWAALPAMPGWGWGLSCLSQTYCAAVTGYSVVVFDGHRWTPAVDLGLPEQLVGISCGSRSLCLAWDDRGNVVRYNGYRWSTPMAVPHWLTGLSGGLVGFTPTHCWSVTDYLTRYDGRAWSASRRNDGVSGMSCVTGTCVAVDPDGDVLRAP